MKGLSTEEHKDLLRSIGTHRRNRHLSPLEVALLLKKAEAAGTTRKECAEALALGTTQIVTFLKLLDLSSDIQHLAGWGGSGSASIPFSSLAEIARLRSSDHVEAANAILKHRLSWKEVVQIAQLEDRSSKTVSQCIGEVLNLRPQVETLHLFVGEITSDDVKQKIENLSQRERDHMIGRVLEGLLGIKDLVRCRMGKNSFTILSDQNLTKLLNMKPDELEKHLNRALVQIEVTA